MPLSENQKLKIGKVNPRPLYLSNMSGRAYRKRLANGIEIKSRGLKMVREIVVKGEFDTRPDANTLTFTRTLTHNLQSIPVVAGYMKVWSTDEGESTASDFIYMPFINSSATLNWGNVTKTKLDIGGTEVGVSIPDRSYKVRLYLFKEF